MLSRQTQRFEYAVARLDQEKRRPLFLVVAKDRQKRQTLHCAIDEGAQRLGELDGDAVGALAQEDLANRACEGERPMQDGRVDDA